MTDKIKEATLQEMSDIGQEIQQTPDDLLRQSEREGWRYAKECEAEVRRLSVEQKPELVAVIGNWGRVEWADGVYPQIGDRMYSAPPSKPWVSLTDDEIIKIVRERGWGQSYFNLTEIIEFTGTIEAALRSKNT